VVDFLGGAHLMGAVLAALYQREHTGRGQHVEVALQDAVIPSLSSNIAGFVNSSGQMPERTGNRNGGLAVAPYNAYRAHDGWISVICPTDAHWNRLRALMNDPEADHERFESMAGRCAEMDAVDAIVARWANTRSKSELRKILVEAGIPAAEVVTLGELMEDPHVQARGVLRTVQDAAGPWLTFGSPLFLSDSPEVAPGRPGPLGADTDSILTGLLGLTSEQVGELRNAGAV
jgi:crotonobetainyl-CoA:carnitine CoA-transferase CaiB-like acyl-CoA transferase